MTQLALLTTAEVATVFRCSPRTLFNWRRAGRLHPVKLGRQWLYDRQEIERLCRGERDATTHEINDIDPQNDNSV